MRIGIDGHVLTGKHQGIRTTLTSLLRALAPYAGEHEFVIYSHDPELAHAAIGIDFAYRKLRSVSSLKRLLIEFPSLFSRDGIELGVFQYISPLVGKHLVFIHDILPFTHGHFFPGPFRLRSKLFYSVSMRRAARIVAASEYTRREIEARYRSLQGRISVVLNGPSFSDEVYFQARSERAERLLLTVGRIEPRKNIPLLVEAFLQADVSDTRLLVVGAPDLKFDYKAPDNGRIAIRSEITDEELIGLYRTAGLFVYPSSAEGFGLPLLDATLFGLPVIASNKTALPEVAAGLAWHFDPDSPGAVQRLAARIRDHFSGAPLRSPTQAERRAQARRFSWDRAARDFLDAIEAANVPPCDLAQRSRLRPRQADLPAGVTRARGRPELREEVHSEAMPGAPAHELHRVAIQGDIRQPCEGIVVGS